MLFCHWTQEKTVERRGAENVPCHCGKEKSGTYQCRIYRARARRVLSVHEICILDSRSVLVRILGRRRAPAPDQFYLEENPYQKGNCLGYRGAADNRAADNNSCPDRRKGRVRGQGTRLDTHRVAQESARLCKKLGGFALSLHRASAGRTSKLSRGCDKIILGQAPAIIRRACGSARAGRRAELQYQSFVYPQDSAQRRLVNREADSEYFGRRAPVYYRRLLHDRRI